MLTKKLISKKEFHVLKSEIKELKSMVAAMTVASSKAATDSAVVSNKSRVMTYEPDGDSEVTSL